MRKRTHIIFLMFVLLSGVSIAQFEGAIDMKVTMQDEGKSHQMLYTMMVKKNLMAANIKGEDKENIESKFIFRGDKKVLWIVNDAEKVYLEYSLKDEQKPSAKETEKSNVKVKKTGKKETILGYPCEEVIVEEGNEVTHLWGTTKLGDFYSDLMKSFGYVEGEEASSGSSGWEAELEALKIFPLKIISMENGQVKQTQEVTKIESKSIPVSTFEVPKGYTKQKLEFDMEKMMKEMGKEPGSKKHKYTKPDKDNPGMNVEMEKMMKQLEELQKNVADTTDDE